MRFTTKQIVFREIPEEISLSYLVSGCSKRCPGCHSPDSWSPNAGQILSINTLTEDIDRYQDFMTCVLFLGGDWDPGALVSRLLYVRSRGLKTALYSGEDTVPPEVSRHLNYLKLGPYLVDRGGLDSPNTNQTLYNLDTGICLNSYFHTRRIYDPIEPRAASEKDELHRAISSAKKCS